MRTLTLLFALLVACDELPSWDGYDAMLQAQHGKHINEVVDDWGMPDETMDLMGGEKAFVWKRKYAVKSADRLDVRETRRVDGADYSGEIHRGEEVGVSCRTMLRVDAAGLVVSHKAEGAGCVGMAPADKGSATPAAPSRPAPSDAATLTDAAAIPASAADPASADDPSAQAGVAAVTEPGAPTEGDAEADVADPAALDTDLPSGETDPSTPAAEDDAPDTDAQATTTPASDANPAADTAPDPGTPDAGSSNSLK